MGGFFYVPGMKKIMLQKKVEFRLKLSREVRDHHYTTNRIYELGNNCTFSVDKKFFHEHRWPFLLPGLNLYRSCLTTKGAITLALLWKHNSLSLN